MNHRVIARLDIKGPNLVKGIHLEGLRVLGTPENFAKYYYETGADELMYIDVVASLYNRNSLHEIIKKTAREIFIPLTVGGGIRSIEDIKYILRAGADKISLNTAAINNPELIKEASRKFGSSTIVVTIEAIKSTDGRYLAYTDNGREFTGIEVLEWAQRVEELGAGEVMITSVDKEGTGLGLDVELTKMVAEHLTIPVIAHGGIGCAQHVSKGMQEGKADAVAISSILHYETIKRQGQAVDNSQEGNIEFLISGGTRDNIQTACIDEIKTEMMLANLPCRYDIHTKEKFNEASRHN